MKRKLTVKKTSVPAELTEWEELRLENYFRLPGWQFDSVILPECIFIQEPIVRGYFSPTKEGKESTYESVCVYGLMGIGIKSGQKEVATFFVRDGEKVYQCEFIHEVENLIDLIRKHLKRLEYENAKIMGKENKKAA